MFYSLTGLPGNILNVNEAHPWRIRIVHCFTPISNKVTKINFMAGTGHVENQWQKATKKVHVYGFIFEFHSVEKVTKRKKEKQEIVHLLFV